MLVAGIENGCSGGEDPRVKTLLELAPDLPQEAARHLVLSDDSTFAAYIHEVGLINAENILLKVLNAYPAYSAGDYEKSLPVLLPCLKKVTDLLTREHKSGNYEKLYEFHRDAGPEEVMLCRRAIAERDSIVRDPNLTEFEKIEKLKKMLHIPGKIRLNSLTALVALGIAECYADAGNNENKLRWFHIALEEAREAGNPSLQCQILGALGSIYADREQIDSMVVCYEEVKRLADLHVMPGRAERINAFYANYYKNQGRLSLAADLYNRNLQACTENKLGYARTGVLLDAMKFHADLGAWEVVGRMLPQVRSVESRDTYAPKDMFEGIPFRIDRIEARYRMERGEVVEAERLFRGIKKNLNRLAARLDGVELYYYWVQGLLQNGLPARALPLIGEGYDLAVEMNQPRFGAQFVLFRARAFSQLGEIEKSESSLEQFERAAIDLRDELRREWIERDLLRIEIARARGDDRAAIEALEHAVARFRYYVGKTDAGMQAYLWIGRHDKIRLLMHDAFAAEPELGYGAELFWRDICRFLENHDSTQSSGSEPGLEPYATLDLRPLCRAYAEAARKQVVEHEAIHCVYATRENEIWRFTCTSAGIRSEILATATDHVDDLVRRTWKMMSSDPHDPGAPAQPELVKHLRELALVLLPPEVVSGAGSGEHRPLFVTADGALAHLPFETLDVGGAGEYRPLLFDRDVAYLRHADKRLTGNETLRGGVILANSSAAGNTRGGNTPVRDLAEALAEGREVYSMRPGSAFLCGDSTTKHNLASRWENGSFLYVATHVVRDPDAPYLALIPLANPYRLGPAASYLEVRDIRLADLRKNNIVVLSGCASGAPYKAARSQAPGLGDVFLDAGAGVVIHTFWDVRDDTAKDLMTAFVGKWGTNTSSMGLMRSFSDAKRAAARGPNGVRHPFDWAAYTIKVGRL